MAGGAGQPRNFGQPRLTTASNFTFQQMPILNLDISESDAHIEAGPDNDAVVSVRLEMACVSVHATRERKKRGEYGKKGRERETKEGERGARKEEKAKRYKRRERNERGSGRRR